MKIKLIYQCYHDKNLSFKRTRSSNIWSINEQNLGTFVKVVDENSLSTDDLSAEMDYF